MNKIAVIDDNMIFRKVTKMHIKKTGFLEENILVFKNGKEIYDFIKNNIKNIDFLPKTLFLDLNMPIMDGWDFLKRLQEIKLECAYNPNIYVITSSVNDKDYKEAMEKFHVKGYLVKPINTDVLSKIIQL